MLNSHTYLKIYKRRVHLLIVIFVVALPFLFTFFLSPLTNAETAVFLKNLGISSLRLAAAYLISLIAALFFAFLLLRGRWENFFLPLFDVLQSFPTFAILPLAVYFIGASNVTVISFLVFTVIWPILFAVASSLKLARRDWEEAAKIYGAKGIKKIVYFTFPLSYPGIVTGSIVGLGEGWEAIIGSEIIIGMQNGLGQFFFAGAHSAMLTAFGVAALLLFIFSLNKLILLPLLEKSHRLLSD